MLSKHASNPPGALYCTVNGVVGLLYGIALPVWLCSLAKMSWWLVVIITLAWLLVNGRTIDRWIPAITDAPIRFIYGIFQKNGNEDRA